MKNWTNAGRKYIITTKGKWITFLYLYKPQWLNKFRRVLNHLIMQLAQCIWKQNQISTVTHMHLWQDNENNLKHAIHKKIYQNNQHFLLKIDWRLTNMNFTVLFILFHHHHNIIGMELICLKKNSFLFRINNIFLDVIFQQIIWHPSVI